MEMSLKYILYAQMLTMLAMKCTWIKRGDLSIQQVIKENDFYVRIVY